MNACEHEPLIHAYHDGELAPEKAAFVEAHLAQCPACDARLRALRSLSATIRFAPRPAMPEGLLARVHQRVDDAAEAGAYRFAWRLIGVAAAIAVASLIHLGFSGTQTTTTGSAAAAKSPAWETNALLAMVDSRSGSAGDEMQMAQWIREDLSAGSDATRGDSHD